MAHRLRERHLGGESIEHIVERAREYRFNALDFVARSHEVIDGVNDGQARSDIGFKEEFHTPLASQRFEMLIVVVITRSRDFVGSDHMDVVVKQARIVLCYLCRSRAIDKDGVEHIHLFDGVEHGFNAA